MSRVLVFTQAGDKRPVAWKCPHEYRDKPGRMAAHIAEWRDYPPLKLLSLGVLGKACLADRWWLVECENAEAGRRYIKDQFMDDSPGYRAKCARRILASGEGRCSGGHDETR
jgi:hypothetical protein